MTMSLFKNLLFRGSHSLHFKVSFVATINWMQVNFQIFQILRPHRKRGELNNNNNNNIYYLVLRKLTYK